MSVAAALALVGVVIWLRLFIAAAHPHLARSWMDQPKPPPPAEQPTVDMRVVYRDDRWQ